MILNVGTLPKMLSVLSSKSIRHLGIRSTTNYLNNNCSYYTCMKVLCNRNIDKYHLTSKTSITPKPNLTNKINNFTSATNEQCGENLSADYDDIVEAQNNNKILIIDVREESEIKETGKLPGSIHIPMADVSNELANLSNQEFEAKYNRKKPTLDTRIILSCRSGKRSALVQSNIQKMGYKNAINYIGGWLDWESKQKN